MHLALADQRCERLRQLIIGGVEALDTLLDLLPEFGPRRIGIVNRLGLALLRLIWREAPRCLGTGLSLVWLPGELLLTQRRRQVLELHLAGNHRQVYRVRHGGEGAALRRRESGVLDMGGSPDKRG